MASYKLTNKAVDDLSKIWDYTFEIWSERQADKYFLELMSSCQEIAESPEVDKNYEGIAKQLFGLKTNRHIIFHRIAEKDYIEITRILPERMDLKKMLTQ